MTFFTRSKNVRKNILNKKCFLNNRKKLNDYRDIALGVRSTRSSELKMLLLAFFGFFSKTLFATTLMDINKNVLYKISNKNFPIV